MCVCYNYHYLKIKYGLNTSGTINKPAPTYVNTVLRATLIKDGETNNSFNLNTFSCQSCTAQGS